MALKQTRAGLRQEITEILPSFRCVSIDGYRGRGYISLDELEAIRNELLILRRL